MAQIRSIYGKIKFLLEHAKRGNQESLRGLAELLVADSEARLRRGESELPFTHFGREGRNHPPLADSLEAVHRVVGLAAWIGLLDESGKLTQRAQRTHDFDNLINRLVNEKVEGAGERGLGFPDILVRIRSLRIPDFDTVYDNVAKELPDLTRNQFKTLLNLKVATGNLKAHLRRVFAA